MLSPTNNDTIYLGDDDDLMDTLIFSWSDAIDIDNDEISYSLFKSDITGDESILVGTSTQWSVTVQSIYDMMVMIGITNYDLTWYVVASDGEATVQSSQTFTFYIDSSEMLSIENNLLIPGSFGLHQNYPNPFNPLTNIFYDISERTNVEILVYDVTGRVVSYLKSGVQEPGQYKIEWNAVDRFGRRLSGGIYIYQIKTEKFVKSRKMVLLK